jgi:outer membrane protein OmpA-like peptidoglycan-associated protein
MGREGAERIVDQFGRRKGNVIARVLRHGVFSSFCFLFQPSLSIAQAVEPISEPVVYMVLFEADSVEITDTATLVLNDAVRYYDRNKPVIVQVDGHYDRGSDGDYADRMSRRIAENVRGYLIANGVPASSIKLYWVGDLEPVVPGRVNEEFNRRVDISFDFSQE